VIASAITRFDYSIGIAQYSTIQLTRTYYTNA